MPGTTWPVNGHPPGSSRDYPPAPVSMPANLFRHVNGYNARLPDPRLTREPGLLPHRSPRQSSANAAVGGLKPPPQGDSEGPTILHLVQSTTSGSSPITLPSAFVTHVDRGLVASTRTTPPTAARSLNVASHQPSWPPRTSSYTSGACAASPQSDGKPRHYAGTRSRRPLKLAGTADYWLAVVQSQYRAPVFVQFRGHI